MVALDTVRIFLFLTLSPLLMRLQLASVSTLVSRPVRRQTPDPGRVARTIRLIDLMTRFGRPFIVPGCLTRGLALYYFLRRLGLDVALVFGHGKVNDQFAAHCWLERDNEPYLEKVNPHSHFVPVYRFGNAL